MEFERGLAQGILEEFPLNIAVLDGEGIIRWVNRAWREFGDENGLGLPDYGVGTPYVPRGAEPHDPYATLAADGVTAVVEGERDTYTVEYPCHGPDELRWFRMYAAGIEMEDGRYCIVSHENITDEKLADLMTEAHSAEATTLTRMLLHDMRNSVATAGGWLAELYPETEDKRKLAPVVAALTRIEDTIADSREVLRMAGDRPEYEKEDIESLARTAWDRIETPEATLVVEDEFPVLCYPRQTGALLYSLFRNAVEAEADVTVRISLGEREFHVDDDRSVGVPDPPEQVFERAPIRHDGRMAFGLSLVTPLAVMHGWSTSLTPGPRGGWRFTVRTEQVHV